jgi:hypothetical protein
VTWVAYFYGHHAESVAVPAWGWAVLVVGVDVAHVYSTLFRTYLDRVELRRRPWLYTLVPVVGLALGTVAYAFGALVFWRLLAYLAVFHFVRQQYGFLRIYSRREVAVSRFSRLVDSAVIYLATLYPLIYWHTHLPRRFNWFVDGDFLALPYPGAATVVGWIYIAFLLLYVAKEFRLSRWNLPKNLLVLGTAISWYVGIVVFNGDLGFTAINVISHGIPYMALIWATDSKRRNLSWDRVGAGLLRYAGAYIGVLVLLAYLEEGLWDGLIWREHASVFGWASVLPRIERPELLLVLVPLLSLPQITHYLLDGFVWKLRGQGSEWAKE